jgi:predicted alpha/beta-fold hydrolase
MRSQPTKNIYTSLFQPATILKNPHLQTIWAAKIRRIPKFNSHSERIDLPDGDFLDLEWSPHNHRGLILLLHGLEGGIDSNYIQGLMKALDQKGYQSVLLQFRGCSTTPNRLARSYHAGETEDLSYVAALLRQRLGRNLLAIAGFSLGANVMLKWLGESNRDDIVNTAIAVSPPFDLASSADHLNTGFSKIYQHNLVNAMKKKYRQKFVGQCSRLSDKVLNTLTSFRDFDDLITGPIHGFDSAEEYYKKCSCRQYLKKNQITTLILHSKDDPFLPVSAIPEAHELGSDTTMELSNNGGHVGFISQAKSGSLGYWLESRILSYLDDFNRHLI